MPSSLTHAAVPISIAIAAHGRIGWRLLAAGTVAAVLPDVDFAGHWLDVPYGSDFAHRGALHSLAFAALIGAAGALCAVRLRASTAWAGAFLFVCAASHGLLDMLTHGGRGVMYLWPFSGERLFLPWQPLASMPRSFGHALQATGATLRAEVRWVWLPCLALAFAVRIGRRA